MKETNQFDFAGAMSDYTQLEKKQQAEAQKEKTKKKVLVGVGLAVVATAGYSVHMAIEKNHKKIDETIIQAKTNNSPLGETIDWLMAQESAMRSQKNATEQLMTSAIAQKKVTVELLNAEREVGALFKKLNDAHIADAKAIQNMIVDLRQIQSLIDKTDYSDKEALIESSAFKNWSKITELKKNGKMEFTNLAAVSKEYQNFMNELVTFEKQYIQVIKEVIASGNFSLNQTQAEIMRNIQAESAGTRKEFEDVHKEITESARALSSEGQSTEGLNQAFTERDLANAQSAINDMENAALKKAIEDKNTVEAMIASINQGQSVEEALGMSGQAPATTTTTTTTHSSGGGGSMMPFLMGMWLGNAFSSSPTYNNVSNASTANNTMGTKQAERQAGSGGGSSASGVAANSSRFSKAMDVTKPTNAYSFRNQDSYLNKTAANSSRALGSTSLQNAQSKLNTAKVAANRATSLKQAAFSKAGIAPNTKASQARMAISQNRAAVASRAASVSSRGGFSSSGFSSGG